MHNKLWQTLFRLGGRGGWGIFLLLAALGPLLETAASAQFLLPPQAVSQTAVVAPNEDKVVTLVGRQFGLDPLTFRVNTLPASGELYQYVKGKRGKVITKRNTQVQDAGHRVIYVPAPGDWVRTSFAFTFVVANGTGQSLPAVVTLRLRAARVFTLPTVLTETNEARLHAVAVGNSLPTTAWFEWGPMRGAMQPAGRTNLGTGMEMQRLYLTVSNLPARSDFQCRLVVSNALGLQRGLTKFFTTGTQIGQAVEPGHFEKTNDWGQDIIGLSVYGGRNLFLRSDGWVVGDYTITTNVIILTNLAPESRTVAIAAGGYHQLALLADGRVTAWADGLDPGGNGYTYDRGQTNLPPGLSNVVAIAAGAFHSLALRADGKVLAWGDNTDGQTNVPEDAHDVVAIAAGEYHSLALRADGNVVTWGASHRASKKALLTIPAEAKDGVAIADGYVSSALLRADGKAIVWYSDFRNDFKQRVVVKSPSGGIPVSEIYAGPQSLSSLDVQGRISRVPGINLTGLTNVVGYEVANYNVTMLGRFHPRAFSQQVEGWAGEDLVVGLTGKDANHDLLSYRIAALPKAGKLYQYDAGQRGAEITAPNTPVTDTNGWVIFAPRGFGTGRNVAQFSFRATDGALDSVPATVRVSLKGSTHAITLPVLPGGTGAVVRLQGTVCTERPSLVWFEWGPRGSTQKIAGRTNLARPTPHTWLKLALTNLPSAAVLQCRIVVSDATGVHRGNRQFFSARSYVTGWSRDRDIDWKDRSGALAVATNYVALSAGGSSFLTLQADGTAEAFHFGYKDYQGDGNDKMILMPMEAPPGLSPATAISASARYWGNYTFSVLHPDNSQIFWSFDGSERYDWEIPADSRTVMAIVGGLRLLSDGSVVTEEGTRILSSVTNISALAHGEYHYLALQADGTVKAWGGNNWNGETTVPKNLSNVVAIAAGGGYSLALQSNGRVRMWGTQGTNAHVAGTLRNIVAISARGVENAALRSDGRVMAWSFEGDGFKGLVKNLTNAFRIEVGAWRYGLALQGRAGATAYTALSRVAGPAVQPPVLAAGSARLTSGGAFTLHFQGTPGTPYHVWASSDLLVWQDLGVASETTAGEFDFAEVPSASAGQRFYKVTPP